ncbi:MAG: hypothetical protein U5L08_08020 [Xanthomonadales bacterium]|nr:hypothetical protein [Xanthomonadales bacterium]
MKRNVFQAISIVMILALSGCGGGAGDDEAPVGEITATLEGNTYKLPARCREYDGEISVESIDDESGARIVARQMGEKLNLDVFVTDGDYSTPNLDQWQRTENGVSGSGRLRLDGAEQYREYPVSFEAHCE